VCKKRAGRHSQHRLESRRARALKKKKRKRKKKHGVHTHAMNVDAANRYQSRASALRAVGLDACRRSALASLRARTVVKARFFWTN
jgi:hypothetical protein